MQIKVITTGAVAENCYLVCRKEKLFVIDPGADAPQIIRAAQELNFSSAEILLTHAHADHIGAVAELKNALNAATVRLFPEDRDIYFSPDNAFPPFIPAAENLPTPDSYIENEDFNALHTPGHTPGGASLLFEDDNSSELHLFSGDTLFAGSIGRTDFPGGSMQVMQKTLKMLVSTLDDRVIIHPGHGPSSTIGNEKKNNIYLNF